MCFCPLPHSPPHHLTIQIKRFPEVRVENSTRSLVESDAEAAVETARCSVRQKHLELQVCNSWPMRSMCHDDDGIYRLTLLYMNLAQLAVARMQDNGIAHCILFISPQVQLKTPEVKMTPNREPKLTKSNPSMS